MYNKMNTHAPLTVVKQHKSSCVLPLHRVPLPCRGNTYAEGCDNHSFVIKNNFTTYVCITKQLFFDFACFYVL